jgi:hypothetical protein
MTKADSAFGAWYKESAFTTQWNFAGDTVTADITLHAKWNCACNPKDHLDIGETCNCNTAPCGCTLHEYGKLGGVIPIYKSGTVADMDAAVTKIQTVYNDPMIAAVIGQLASKVDAVYVIPGSSTNKNDRILEIGCDATQPSILGLLGSAAVSSVKIDSVNYQTPFFDVWHSINKSLS